jgi:hypothetical protein
MEGIREYRKPSPGGMSRFYSNLVENSLMIILGVCLKTNVAKSLAKMSLTKNKKYGISLFIDAPDGKQPQMAYRPG